MAAANILDPELGGKIRAYLLTAYATFVALAEYVHWSAQSWYGVVVTVVGAILIVIQGLTHGTDLGNADAEVG
jgi:hypothetical protein